MGDASVHRAEGRSGQEQEQQQQARLEGGRWTTREGRREAKGGCNEASGREGRTAATMRRSGAATAAVGKRRNSRMRVSWAATAAASALTIANAAAVAVVEGGSLTYEGHNFAFGNSSAFESPAQNAAYSVLASVSRSSSSSLYVGGDWGGLAWFSVDDATGALSLLREWNHTDLAGALVSVEQLGMSPDGTVLVAVGNNVGGGTVGVFDVQADGNLTLNSALHGPAVDHVKFSPDSSQDFYTTNATALSWWTSRDTSGSGEATSWAAQEEDSQPVYAKGFGVHPSGKYVYVADEINALINTYARDGATGALTLSSALQGAFNALDGVSCLLDLQFSTDGLWAYGLDACVEGVTTFAVSQVDGSLSVSGLLVPGQNPLGNDVALGLNLVVAPDGSGDVYVLDNMDSYIVWLRPDPLTGLLYTVDFFETDVNPVYVAITADSHHVYVTHHNEETLEVSHYERLLHTGAGNSKIWGISESGFIAMMSTLSGGALLLLCCCYKKRSRYRQAGEEGDDSTTLVEGGKEVNKTGGGGLSDLISSLRRPPLPSALSGIPLWWAKRGSASEETQLREILEEAPRDPVAHNNLGLLLQDRRKDNVGAEEHFKLAVKYAPRATYALNSYGHFLLHEKHELVEAERLYRRAQAADRDDGLAYFNLGYLMEKHKGDWAGAEKQYREALRCDPGDTEAAKRLNKVMNKTAKLTSFVDHQQQQEEKGHAGDEEGGGGSGSGKISPGSGKIFLGDIKLHLKGGGGQQEVTYRQNVNENPKDATAHNNLGMLLMERNKLDEAEYHFREAIKHDRRAAFAHNSLAYLLQHKRKDYAGAEKAYRAAIAAAPDFVMAHYNLGFLLEKELGRPADAAGEYEMCLTLDENDDDARKRLEKVNKKLLKESAAPDSPV